MTLDPKQLASQIGTDATALQNTASDPSHNVWVGASAGTGKTKVLTDRVLRLLLPKEGEGEGRKLRKYFMHHIHQGRSQ